MGTSSFCIPSDPDIEVVKIIIKPPKRKGFPQQRATRTEPAVVTSNSHTVEDDDEVMVVGEVRAVPLSSRSQFNSAPVRFGESRRRKRSREERDRDDVTVTGVHGLRNSTPSRMSPMTDSMFDFLGFMGRNQEGRSSRRRVRGIGGMAELLSIWERAGMRNNEPQVNVAEIAPQEEEETSLEGKTCPICLDGFKNITATPCGHCFCWNCIQAALNKKPECPHCRKRVTTSELRRLFL